MTKTYFRVCIKDDAGYDGQRVNINVDYLVIGGKSMHKTIIVLLIHPAIHSLLSHLLNITLFNDRGTGYDCFHSVKNPSLDLDPCRNVSCKYHSHCVALSPRRFTCRCESSCPSYEEQFCASNGRTFRNLCLLRKEVCRTRANYTSYHPGSCTGIRKIILI